MSNSCFSGLLLYVVLTLRLSSFNSHLANSDTSGLIKSVVLDVMTRLWGTGYRMILCLSAHVLYVDLIFIDAVCHK